MFGRVFASAAVIAAMGAGASHASTVDVTYTVPGNSFGSEALYQSVTISTPNDPQFDQGGLYDGSAPAGRFQLTGSNGMGEFAAFCVELAQALQSGFTYTVSDNLFTGRIRDNIDRLFSSAYGNVDTTLEASAFQVALWEIVHDDGDSYDLTAGDVRFSGNDAVIAEATGYLNGLAGAQMGLYEVSFLSNPTSQDVVTGRLAVQPSSSPAPIPLPASALLLLGGVGGLAALRRKQRKT